MKQRILVAAPRAPEPDRESGARRVYDHLRLLCEAGWQVSFVALQPGPDDAAAAAGLRALGVENLDGRVEALLDSGAVDVALLAFWHVAERLIPMVRARSPRTRVIVDSIDLHFLRSARAALRVGGIDEELARQVAREWNVYGAADRVLTVSEKEAGWVDDVTGRPGLGRVVRDTEEPIARARSGAARRGALFVGNFWHRPNVEAVRFLCGEIVPRLDPRVLAAHPVSIVGHALGDEVRGAIGGRRGVVEVGWVPSLAPLLAQARVAVAPLLHGAGTKRKVLQALAAGVPSVATSLAAEGLGLRHGRDVLIADDAPEFARAIELVARDDKLWRRLSAAGRALVAARHGAATVAMQLHAAIDDALSRPPRAEKNAQPSQFSPNAQPGSLSPNAQPEPLGPPKPSPLFAWSEVESRRPSLTAAPPPLAGRRPSVLVVGVYLGNKPGNVDDLVQSLAGARRVRVTQRWAAVGGGPPTRAVAAVTRGISDGPRPKWTALAPLIADARGFDYLVVVDDDVVLPPGFLDALIGWQARFGFALAQPARTCNSFIDHPITAQQRGVVARRTRYVESGPVMSFHRSAFPHVLPFDLRSPMGWGYGNVWAHDLERAGLRLGIIDAAPVDHGLRRPAEHYRRDDADLERRALLEARPHLPLDDCFRVLDVYTGAGRRGAVKTFGAPAWPAISVVVTTRNRAALLEECLESFAAQRLPRERFEVVVVDDGSSDETARVCCAFARRLPMRALRIPHSGRSAAKNLGLFVACGRLVIFFDDDDVADPDLLVEHLRAHTLHLDEHVAVLGYTAWAPRLRVTPLMRYVTEIGQNLFSYPSLRDGAELDFRHFWGGRTSCKRSLLTRRGIHDQSLDYYVDIELGYRLARHGLKVVYHRRAVSYMNRAMTFAQFCRRVEAKGRALARLAALHGDDPRIRDYCRLASVHRAWPRAAAEFGDWRRRAERGGRARHLWYRRVFDALTSRGFLSAGAAADSRAAPG